MYDAHGCTVRHYTAIMLAVLYQDRTPAVNVDYFTLFCFLAEFPEVFSGGFFSNCIDESTV